MTWEYLPAIKIAAYMPLHVRIAVTPGDTVTIPYENTNTTITGLVPDTLYSITVVMCASDSVCDTTETTTSLQTPANTVDQPTNFRWMPAKRKGRFGTYSAQLLWDAPADCPVEKYIVRVRSSGATFETVVPTMELHGIAVLRTYDISVATVNSYGMSRFRTSTLVFVHYFPISFWGSFMRVLCN